MERNEFSKLLEEFESKQNYKDKVDTILKYNYKKLTNPQIDKLLNTMPKQEDIKKFMRALTMEINR